MLRHLSLALTAAATIGLTMMGLSAAVATRADGGFGSQGTTDLARVVSQELRPVRPKPSPTPTPTHTPSSPAPTATTSPTPAPSSPAPSGVPCAFPTISFNGDSYCPASVVGVRDTIYGTGTRVVLRGVTVTEVTTSTMTVAIWTVPPCPPGIFCGQTLTLESLTVPWTGTSRPAYGDVLDLFGRTIPASLTPAGYVKTGYCPIDLC